MADGDPVRRTSNRERRKPQPVYDLSAIRTKEQSTISQGPADDDVEEEASSSSSHDEGEDEEIERVGTKRRRGSKSSGERTGRTAEEPVTSSARSRRAAARSEQTKTGASKRLRGKVRGDQLEDEDEDEDGGEDGEGGEGDGEVGEDGMEASDDRRGGGDDEEGTGDGDGGEDEAEDEGDDGDEEEEDEGSKAPSGSKRRKSTGKGGAPKKDAATGKGKRGVSTPFAGRAPKGRSPTSEGSPAADRGDHDDREHQRGVSDPGRRAGLVAGEENGLMEAVKRNAALVAVVGDWVSAHEKDPGQAMEEMINFVLLSCGAPCTDGPYALPEDVDPADMDAEHWAALMEEVKEDMQSSPWGSTHGFLAHAARGKAGKEARGFRANFCEVFERLTEACRRGAGHNTAPLSAVCNAMVMMSQQESADARLASTLAAMQLGLGIAEGLSDLSAKRAVAQRQLDGAMGSRAKPGGGADKARKTKSLSNQVNRLSSAMEGLTEIADTIQSKVVHKRYRDVSMDVRSCVVEGLTGVMLALPEVYVQDRLMRYLGWSLSDREASVRTSTLQAMQQLLANEAVCPKLGKFFGHFFPRIKSMLLDVDGVVCREAAVVLRLLLAAGFLEGMQEEDAMEVESNIFEAELPLAARVECMGFFVDRLEEFVETDMQKVSGGGRKGGKGKGGKSQGSKADEDEQLSLMRLESVVQLVNVHVEALSTREDERASGPLKQIEEQFACADAAVEALWRLPQAPVLRRWRALCKLLDNEEAGGGDAGASGTGQAVKGALDGNEQTIAARVMLTSAKMAWSEASTGRKKNGQTLTRDAKQELRESMSELTEACLTHLPNLLAKYQSDDAKLALLSELPVFVPKKALASLVSGTGKGAFSDLLNRMKDAFLMSTSPAVMDAAAASLLSFLTAEHAKRAEVEAVVQEMLGDLCSKACSLCLEDQGMGDAAGKEGAPKGSRGKKGSSDRSWKDLGTALGLCLRRLRSLLGAVDPRARLDVEEKGKLWEAVKSAIQRRCSLDQVLPPLTPKAQEDARLEMARQVIEEGCHVLYTLFLWRMKSVFSSLKHSAKRERVDGGAGGAEDEDDGSDAGGEGGGDEGGSSPTRRNALGQGRGRGREEGTEAAILDGDGAGEGEDLTKEDVEGLERQRDALVEILRGMLSMHLQAKGGEDDGGRGGAGAGEPPLRDLTEEQKKLLVQPVGRAAWFTSHELQTLLKAFLSKVEGPTSRLPWQPDASFTRLLQEHFENEEEALIASLDDHSGAKKAPRDGRAEDGEGREDDDDGAEGGDDDSVDVLTRKLEDCRAAGDLLLPIMKSILSNADRLNRRQAAAVVSHIVHSSPAAGALAKCFLSKLKEYNPIRCLQVHIATLQVYYEKWVASPSRADEREEDGDDEQGPRRWKREEAGLEHWIPLAHRLSLSLGVGPLRSKNASDQKTLQNSFLLFTKELVRFAFSADGERLLVLEGVKEYLSKLSPRQKRILASLMDQQVKKLDNKVLDEGREYAGVWDDDDEAEKGVPPRWKAFFNVRNSLAPGTAMSFLPEPSEAEEESFQAERRPPSTPGGNPSSGAGRGDGERGPLGTPASRAPGGRPDGSSSRQAARTTWRGGSGGPRRARASVASDLFPVEEETRQQEEEDDDEAEGGGDGETVKEGALPMTREQADDGRSAPAGSEQESEGGGDEAGPRIEDDRRSVVSEVHTPNKRRMADMTPSAAQDEAEAEEHDLLEDLAFGRSQPKAVEKPTKRSRTAKL